MFAGRGRGHPGCYSAPSASTTGIYRQTYPENTTNFQANTSLSRSADAESTAILPLLEQHQNWPVGETNALRPFPDSYSRPLPQTSDAIKTYGQTNITERLDQIAHSKSFDSGYSTYIEAVQEPTTPIPGFYHQAAQNWAVGIPENAYEVAKENNSTEWHTGFTQESLYQPCPNDSALWNSELTSASSKILNKPIQNKPTEIVLYRDLNRSALIELHLHDTAALPNACLISFDKFPLNSPIQSTNLGRKKLTKEQKRQNHIAHEQKRRNEYKKSLESLIAMVPGLKSQGLSKSAVLAEAAHWLTQLQIGNEVLRVQAEALEMGATI